LRAHPRSGFRLLLAAATAVAVAQGLAACARPPLVAVGLLYPSAGSQGSQGTQERRGAELAARWADDHHVLGARRLELVSVPADRAEAVPAAMAQLARSGVGVVVGSHGSAISAMAAGEATRRGMLVWETGAVGETSPEVAAGTSFFRMAPMGANLGRAGIAFVRDHVAGLVHPPAPLRYAVAYVDDPYGRAVAAGALAEVEGSGQVLAGRFPYQVGRTDYAGLARDIAAARPDVLYVSAYLDDGVALRRELVAQHVPLLANVGTSSSYCLPEFGRLLGADAVGTFASDKPDAADVRADSLSAEGRQALRWASAEYRRRYGDEMSAPALSGFSNAFALFVHVLPRAGGADARTVAQVALSTKLPEGTLANGAGMDLAPPGAPDAGDNRAAAGVIWEWVGPGQRAVVWPPAYATHAIEPLSLSR
jgi:branched-chain amino acid transport system substrate-binding protein